MQYPAHLLPKPSFKFIQWGEWLEDYHLLRHTPDDNVIDEETGLLKLDYIVPEGTTSQLRDFSTFLLGIFLPEDRIWAIKGQRKSYFLYETWTEGEVVEEPSFPEDFEKDERRGAFYLRIGDIVNQEVTYQIGGHGEFIAVCKVIHTPTRSNFWHFSIRWFNEEGDIYPHQSGNWIKRMLKTSVKTLIRENVILDTPDFKPVAGEHYKRQDVV